MIQNFDYSTIKRILLFDGTYRDDYDMVMNEIKRMTNTNCTELKFKKKYKPIFGHYPFCIYHRTYFDHIRIISIEPEYEGVSSLLLTPIQILLSMEINYNSNYSCHNFLKARNKIGQEVEHIAYDFYSEDEEGEDDEDDEQVMFEIEVYLNQTPPGGQPLLPISS